MYWRVILKRKTMKNSDKIMEVKAVSIGCRLKVLTVKTIAFPMVIYFC